jgi:Ala-tRNA(Pro) deacylase
MRLSGHRSMIRILATEGSNMTSNPHSGFSATRIAAVTEYLRGEGIQHEVIEHRETMSAAAEAAATDHPPQQVAKTVVLHDGGAYLLAVIPASRRLDLHKLRELLGASKSLQLANERQISEDFPQLEVGAVPPLGPMVPAAEVIDQRLLDEERVLCAGGDHTHSVLLDPRDMVAATDATVADICED